MWTPPLLSASRTTAVVAVLAATLGACTSRNTTPEPGSEAYRETISAFYAGLAAIESGTDRLGEEKLLRVTELAPGEPSAWANLGLLALRRNEPDAAAERLERAQALAPENSAVHFLLGVLESNEGNPSEASRHFRQAVTLDSTNVRAWYALAEQAQTEQTQAERARAEDGALNEAAALLETILTLHPDNLAVLLQRADVAARLGDADTHQQVLAHLESLAHDWPSEARAQLNAWSQAASGLQTPSDDPQAAVTHIAFLRNVLLRHPAYRESLLQVQMPAGQFGEWIMRPLRIPLPTASLAPPDDGLTFVAQEVPVGEGPWKGMVVLSPDGDGEGPLLAATDGRNLRLLEDPARPPLPFPGGPTGTGPGLHGIAEIDINHDFVMDLALAGVGGLRLYHRDTLGTFTEATARASLPTSLLNEAYTGVWAADLDLEGDVDLVLGRSEDAPVVLRNNGDDTFVPLDLFAGSSGLRDFVWADVDGDGDPDASLLDSNGTVHLFVNERSGRFERQSPRAGRSLALEAADLDADAVVDLVVLQADGTILRISGEDAVQPRGDSGTPGEDPAWPVETVAQWTDLPADLQPGTVRLTASDLDNNGGLDLLVATPKGARFWLGDSSETWLPLVHHVDEQVFAVADFSGNGRLDLLGLSEDGRPVRLENRGTKPYHWKKMFLRAAQALGDQRINSFGIGGEVEIRAGLTFQKQIIESPVVHFGLGTNAVADVARIVWPNGSVQAEFDLLSGQVMFAQQRLKGSCPWLFAHDGEAMRFVTDFIWRSPLGLRINAQETAGIMTTEDWVKIRGDQLTPRNGYYDVRITAELWETHFFDHVSLLVVDHPQDTDIYVDERFVFPPSDLRVHVTGMPRPIARAWDDLGQDVTELVQTQDQRYLDTFGRGRYQGVTRDHYVELELGDDAPREGPLWLVAVGWIHPTDSSINMAIGQGDHPVPQGLRLEVADGQGGWKVAAPNLGFPSGKDKTVLIDLQDAFVPGAPRRLRLHTNLEIFWDALSWAPGMPTQATRMQRLDPETADLRYRGFSEVVQADISSPERPVYDQLAGTGQLWRDLIGYYTRFGDVRELLTDVDDRYVIMNAGDELAFRFAASPTPPTGWKRDFVLIGDGWVKDGDYNTGFSKTVLPLPSHDDPTYDTPPTRLEDDPVYRRHREDWLHYHTRYVTPRRFQEAMRLP